MKDIYVKFTKSSNASEIVGETRDATHTGGWFEVNSWQHMIRQPKSATASTAGGHTSERCEHGEMLFTKDLDKISPQLWEACSAGSLYSEVVIDFMRADGTSGKRVKYLEIKLKHVIISSVVPSVLSEGLPTETFGLKYAAVNWLYTQQGIDGKNTSGKPAAWSLSNNTPNYTV